MHVITRKHLSRRHLLRGAGVTVALPFLTAMVPAATALAQTAAVGKPRLGFVYFPHGAVWRHWQPKGEGSNFELKSRCTWRTAPLRSMSSVMGRLSTR